MDRGLVYVFRNRKGGVGKSSGGCFFAVKVAERSGSQGALLVDLNPDQADSLAFVETRTSKHTNRPRLQGAAPANEAQLRTLLESVTAAGIDCVVDCSPAESAMVLEASAMADVLVMPFQTGANEARAMARAVRMALELEGESRAPKLVAYINKHNRRTNKGQALENLLKQSGAFFYAGSIRELKAVDDAVSEGLAPWESEPKNDISSDAEKVMGAILNYSRGSR